MLKAHAWNAFAESYTEGSNPTPSGGILLDVASCCLSIFHRLAGKPLIPSLGRLREPHILFIVTVWYQFRTEERLDMDLRETVATNLRRLRNGRFDAR